jgi:DNA-directed RNA polymerase specialized sigma24 family protein
MTIQLSSERPELGDTRQNEPDDNQQDTPPDPSGSIAQKNWVMTPEAFEQLLLWLGDDRDTGAQTYEQIRSRLIRIFVYRGFVEADEMTDETMNRVTRKAAWLKANYQGDPFHYFKKVADYVCMEYGKKRSDPLPDVLPAKEIEPDEAEPIHNCLDRCMIEKLSPEERYMVIQYFEGDGHTKIVNRQKLAEKLGITLNTLRIRMHRLCRVLRKCVDNCLNSEMELRLS